MSYIVINPATSCDFSERIITRAICQGPDRGQFKPTGSEPN